MLFGYGLGEVLHMNYAIIENGVVTNIVVASEALADNWVASETAAIGDLYSEGQFIGSEPATPAPTSADVDAERDRRISAGFEFEGVWYQSRLPSTSHAGDWEVFSGKALEALVAIMAGAQPGDLRWSNPAEDFAWIAADNSRVPMDAQTVIELGKAASAHRTAHTFAGSDLKALQPIPADYSDDKWWP